MHALPFKVDVNHAHSRPTPTSCCRDPLAHICTTSKVLREGQASACFACYTWQSPAGASDDSACMHRADICHQIAPQAVEHGASVKVEARGVHSCIWDVLDSDGREQARQVVAECCSSSKLLQNSNLHKIAQQTSWFRSDPGPAAFVSMYALLPVRADHAPVHVGT